MTLRSVKETDVFLVYEMLVDGAPMGLPGGNKQKAKISSSAFKTINEGDEEIEVAGKKLKCHGVEIEKKLATGKLETRKTWQTDEIPGRAARIEAAVEGRKTTTIATSWEKK